MTYPPARSEVAGLPEGGPAASAAVRAALKLAAGDAADNTYLDGIVGAVNVFVRLLPIASTVAVPPPAEPPAEWPADIVTGANLLAARLYRRRNSPSGLEAFGDLGASYVQRNDPDVAQLLALGSHSYPQVG